MIFQADNTTAISSVVDDSVLTFRRRLADSGFRLDLCFYCRGMSVELEGKVWEPVPGVTATAEEFIAARSLIHEVHQQASWSPWVLLDPAPEYEAAWETCGQWKSTEPGPPPKTLEEREAELEQRLADADAQFLAKEAQAEKDRAERAERYDPDRAQARLALLEEQGILADKIRERDELLAADVARLPAKDYRRSLLATAERAIVVKSKEVEDLLAVIGDPETVADARGWLPAERREMALISFKSERGSQVRTLRAQIADAKTTLKSLKGRAERAELRESLRRDQAHLAYWEQMTPLQAADMCSECGKPAWHSQGWTHSIDGFYVTGGPCPAWPRWAKGVQAVQEAMRQALRSPPKQPPPPPPQPIAVLAPGVPIEQVIAQLTAIQANHPGAQVRQGRGRRWEIWPAPRPPEPAGPTNS